MSKIKRVSVRDADQYMINMQPFRTRPTLTGIYGLDFPRTDYATGVMTGRLPAPHDQEFRKAAETQEIVYVVYSYETPILWVLSNGRVVMPDVKYSMTTSHHQSATRRAFSTLF